MCGISGYFHRGAASADATVVARMTSALRHRGPDAEGYWQQEKMALGHRRLSIIDLSDRSNQPLLDNSQRYAIVFNGEIYNYRELQSQLKAYPFRTQSDTEVVLAAFIQWGEKCLAHLKGMFAFAIWDAQRQSLFLARDRMGVKPLYYYHDGSTFLFASEIRALLASGKVPRKINRGALPGYFHFQSFQFPHTLVEGIQELGAGCSMEVNDQQ
ncbi:MAG: asparagine synthetase B family protein, partial [Chitinophagaceae bacterium]